MTYEVKNKKLKGKEYYKKDYPEGYTYKLEPTHFQEEKDIVY